MKAAVKKVIADENIVGLGEFFHAGDIELHTLPGRSIDNASLLDAEALLVRSVTPVNAALLKNSPVRFVASATSGTDHLDLDFLAQQGIQVDWAAGANAESVVNYILSALAVLHRDHGLDWLQSSIGIVGAGHIGGRLVHLFQSLGMEVKANDPFLDRESAGLPLYSLEEVLRCDIITLHTPLTRGGPFPTRHLLGEEELANLNDSQVLINAARGSVIDNAALQARLQRQEAPFVILDAWENEPDISPVLLQSVTLGTPHIAGYSVEGKLRGTEMIYRAFCEYFARPLQAPAATDSIGVALKPQGQEPLALLSETILAAYDVSIEHEQCQRLLKLTTDEAAGEFDRLRRDYPRRHEFSRYRVELAAAQKNSAALLAAIGFKACPTVSRSVNPA